jgi:hypothetical protein
MAKRAARFVILLLGPLAVAAVAAPVTARSPPRGAAPAEKKISGPVAAGPAVLRLIQPQLDDLRACYAREHAKNPRLGAAELVLHVIVEANGEIVEATPFRIKAAASETSSVMKSAVSPCVTKRIRALQLSPFPDGLARKIVIGFRFGSDASSASSSAKGGVSPDEIRFGRSVVAGESIGFSRSVGQLTYRYCWKVDSDREGCALRVASLFPSASVKKEVSIYKPGEALNDNDRSAKETRLVRDLTGDDTFRWPPGTELTPVAWPDDAAALVLPDLGLALTAGGGRIDVARAGPDGEEIATPRLELRAGKAAHLSAVYWAPTVPVVAITVRRPAIVGRGDPAQATHVSDVETIQLGR